MDVRTAIKAMKQVEEMSLDELRAHMRALENGEYSVVSEEDRLRYKVAKQRIDRGDRNARDE